MRPIEKNLLKDRFKASPFKYDAYLSWLDDDENRNQDFAIVSTSNYEVHKMEQWNSIGREIYDSEKLSEHVDKIEQILKNISTEKFIIQHEYMPGVWLPNKIIQKMEMNKSFEEKLSSYKRFVGGIDLHGFDGGFEVTKDIGQFLRIFVDYPFLLNYKNIDCISLELDLIMKITHHLEVQFISSNAKLMDSIRDQCHQNNLKIVSSPT